MTTIASGLLGVVDGHDFGFATMEEVRNQLADALDSVGFTDELWSKVAPAN